MLFICNVAGFSSYEFSRHVYTGAAGSRLRRLGMGALPWGVLRSVLSWLLWCLRVCPPQIRTLDGDVSLFQPAVDTHFQCLRRLHSWFVYCVICKEFGRTLTWASACVWVTLELVWDSCQCFLAGGNIHKKEYLRNNLSGYKHAAAHSRCVFVSMWAWTPSIVFSLHCIAHFCYKAKKEERRINERRDKETRGDNEGEEEEKEGGRGQTRKEKEEIPREEEGQGKKKHRNGRRGWMRWQKGQGKEMRKRERILKTRNEEGRGEDRKSNGVQGESRKCDMRWRGR